MYVLGGLQSAECEVGGMRISTYPNPKPWFSPGKGWWHALSGWVEKSCLKWRSFKYLGVLFTSEGKMECEIDRRIGAASTVMLRSVCGPDHRKKKELSRKAKLSIYWSVYAPTLTYGHELWVVTERTRLRLIVAGRSLRDKVRSSVTREELGVELLLLCIERSQLRWLGHLFRMPPGRLL
ncbi:hypothetical protein L3Q82_004956 [Scortum barcoo]|uniref:Uncharacterized protein n=1 Tax=Scortum barcoo TaxID=214431 RepID=A0ACB8VDX9_9TELE|nr:hypothetical protein L3Q82_004956 [Scortum barcoo]